MDYMDPMSSVLKKADKLISLSLLYPKDGLFIDSLMQNRHNSIANALELHLFLH